MEKGGGIEYDRNGPMHCTRLRDRVGVRRIGRAQIIHLIIQSG